MKNKLVADLLYQIADLLDIKGEVITSPYSFIATSHALLWNNLKPAFCDIEPCTCNIDPN